MGFIDELTINASAGKGGDGVVRWRHEKFKEFGGPSGGDGGRGGDVYVRAVRDVHLLSKYRHNPNFAAGNGGDGQKNDLHGADGEDLYIDIPIGSVVKNLKTGTEVSLVEEDESIKLLSGGRGGRGNASFKSSTNQRPEECTHGEPGESADFDIEIRLIADIGLVGLPSAGKTSLLNTLTNAKGKIGDYPFTTLEPNLGEFYGYIIVDIPGLIEGALDGKGLGHKFLRHIRRTRIIAHLVSLENEKPMEAYKTIRNEIKKYDEELAMKPEIIVLTKSDTVSADAADERRSAFEKVVSEVFVVSLYDDDSVKKLRDGLVSALN